MLARLEQICHGFRHSSQLLEGLFQTFVLVIDPPQRLHARDKISIAINAELHLSFKFIFQHNEFLGNLFMHVLLPVEGALPVGEILAQALDGFLQIYNTIGNTYISLRVRK